MTAVAVTARRPRLTAGVVFMAGAAAVHAGNYAFNVIVGRQLGPALFSEVSLIVTFLLIVTLAATTVQATAARFIAIAADDTDSRRLARWLDRSTRTVTIAAALGLAGASPWLAGLFQLSSPVPLALFAAGLPLYLSQAVHRGVTQGEERFGLLAASYQAEMWVRLGVGVGLLAAGWSVAGAAGALTASFAAGWVVVQRPLPAAPPPPIQVRRQVRAFAFATALLTAGAVLISQSDLIIAKLAFDPATAGAYAAVSLIGRIAFFGTWPVVAFIFPITARRQAAGQPPGRLLAGALGLVGSVSLLLTAAAVLVPGRILEMAFGPAYAAAAPWLWPAVAAAGCFAVANTLFSYHLARGVRTGAGLALAGGIAQLVALVLWHGSVPTLLWVQLTLMAALLAAAVAWHLRLTERN